MITKSHHYLPSTDDTQQLHYIVWTASESPCAVLQLVHGMEEYIDRYDTLARLMAERGWAVIGHDHLGHGLSGRQEKDGERTLDTLSQRGYFTDRSDGADVVIADIHLIHDEAARRWPQLPVFIMGHSMGSFFLRRYLPLYASEVAGAIICGTGWYNALLTGSALLATKVVGALCGWHKRSKFLQTLTSPHVMAFRSEGEGAWLSRDPENVRRFHADPLCGFGFTAGGYRVMYTNLLRVSRCQDYERLRVTTTAATSTSAPAGAQSVQPAFAGFPILVISGAEDSVGGTAAVKKVAAQYRALGFADVTEHVVPGDRHEVIMEPDGPEVRAYIADWLDARLRQ